MYKVGDKVKITNNNRGSYVVGCARNKIGVINCIRNYANNDMIYVAFDEEIYSGLLVVGFFKDEIEKVVPVVPKGKQLLFEFMV